MARLLRGYALVLAAAWVLYLVRSRSAPLSPRLPLASGVQVAASSYDAHRSQHPLFAVDGALGPLGWRPGRQDQTPWIELHFTAARDLDAALVVFRGTSLGGTLSCHDTAGIEVTTAPLLGQRRVERVALSCPQARRLRLSFIPGTAPVVLEISPESSP